MAPKDDNVPLFRVCPNRCKRLGDGRIGYTLVTLDKQSSDELRRRRSRPQVWPEGVCEKLVEGETEHWEFVEIIADESWESFELFCEARDGLLILTKSEGATEETLEVLEIDRQLSLLQAEVQLLEGLSRAESALDLKTEIQEAQGRRPKAVCKEFGPGGGFAQIEVHGARCSFRERPRALVFRPAIFQDQLFPGRWHVAFKSLARGRRPMLFKLGIRHVMRAADKTPFSAIKTAEQLAAEEAERAAAEQRAKDDAILKHTDDPKKLRVKWFKYNQVELARVMSREHADNVYPPKIGSSSLTMQRVVRGFLARKRLRWQRQLELRCELVKAQEQKMRQALPHKDKVLLDVLSEQLDYRSLDQMRYAASAAQMLRNNNLSPFMLMHAAEAVFRLVDVDKSGELDIDELGEVLPMLGIECTHEDLLLVASHFDVDNSGAIDLAEFQDMVQVLCCGGNDVAAAIESVTRRKIAERAVTTHEPPPHEASALQAHDFLSLTQMQLHNKLDELRTRLKVRRQHDANHSLEAQGRAASRKAVAVQPFQRNI